MAEYRIWPFRHRNPIAFHGTTKAAAKSAALQAGKRLRNIAAGFYDEDGTFHPIRASYDYSPRRVGEKRRASKKKKRKRKRR